MCSSTSTWLSSTSTKYCISGIQSFICEFFGGASDVAFVDESNEDNNTSQIFSQRVFWAAVCHGSVIFWARRLFKRFKPRSISCILVRFWNASISHGSVATRCVWEVVGSLLIVWLQIYCRCQWKNFENSSEYLAKNRRFGQESLFTAGCYGKRDICCDSFCRRVKWQNDRSQIVRLVSPHCSLIFSFIPYTGVGHSKPHLEIRWEIISQRLAQNHHICHSVSGNISQYFYWKLRK